MKNTKVSILNQLLLHKTATISHLADLLGLSEISVRHHVMSLEADGFILSSEERHGVGRPRFIYRLTEKGYQSAPTNYDKLSEQALDTMKRVLGSDALLALFTEFGSDIADGYAGEIGCQEHDHRLPEIAAKLTKDGFVLSWTNSAEKYTLTTHCCPFHYLGQKHPEVCTINHALLESLIGQPITINACMLQGDAACTYTYEVQNGK